MLAVAAAEPSALSTMLLALPLDKKPMQSLLQKLDRIKACGDPPFFVIRQTRPVGPKRSKAGLPQLRITRINTDRIQ